MPAGREQLVDSRARDGYACLAVLDGRELDPAVAEAGELLATVLGQDLEQADRRATAAGRGCSGSRGGSRRTG